MTIGSSGRYSGGAVVRWTCCGYPVLTQLRVHDAHGRFRRPARAADRRDTGTVSQQEIDAYLAALDEPKRSTLEVLRNAILEVVPGAEQGLAYGMPAFKVSGRTVAGFAAFKHHLSYMPHSGSVLVVLGDDVAGYETSKGALKFPVDKPLPKPLVRNLINERLRELGGGRHLDNRSCGRTLSLGEACRRAEPAIGDLDGRNVSRTDVPLSAGSAIERN